MLYKVMNKNKQMLTVKDASKVLGINPETLRRWDKRGKLSAKRHPINNYRLYNVTDIEQLSMEINGE